MLIDEINELPKKIQEYPMQIEERFVLGTVNKKRYQLNAMYVG